MYGVVFGYVQVGGIGLDQIYVQCVLVFVECVVGGVGLEQGVMIWGWVVGVDQVILCGEEMCGVVVEQVDWCGIWIFFCVWCYWVVQ